jgi:hypothetical protein
LKPKTWSRWDFAVASDVVGAEDGETLALWRV